VYNSSTFKLDWTEEIERQSSLWKTFSFLKSANKPTAKESVLLSPMSCWSICKPEIFVRSRGIWQWWSTLKINWVSGLRPQYRIPNKTQRFGNWVCFYPQVKRWRGVYSDGASGKSQSQSLDYWRNLAGASPHFQLKTETDKTSETPSRLM
jgi:hypothetical protein